MIEQKVEIHSLYAKKRLFILNSVLLHAKLCM